MSSFGIATGLGISVAESNAAGSHWYVSGGVPPIMLGCKVMLSPTATIIGVGGVIDNPMLSVIWTVS
ncbi:MAG: hypothetical protein AAGK47_04855, partial [Bacteroidota bacterium]